MYLLESVLETKNIMLFTKTKQAPSYIKAKRKRSQSHHLDWTSTRISVRVHNRGLMGIIKYPKHLVHRMFNHYRCISLLKKQWEAVVFSA